MDHRDQDPFIPSQSFYPSKKGSKPQATFLTKLYALLERPEYQSMIRWDANGEQIIVERPAQFALHVLPSVYRQSRFASFSRQLNIYGFVRKVNLRDVDPAIDDPDAGTWAHPTLTRNSPPETVANFKRQVPLGLPSQQERSESRTVLSQMNIPPHQTLPPHHHHSTSPGTTRIPSTANNSPSPSGLQNTNHLDSDVSEISLRSTLDELIHLRIPPSRLTIMDSSEIGCGRYGEVLLATLDGWSRTPTSVAVKELRTVGTRGVRRRVALRLARELKIWAKANHPHVLRLIGYYLSDNYEIAQLISPFMSNGNVSQYLEKLQVGVLKRLDIIRDITLGMNYLHSCNPPICHGDLKPTNILMNDSLQAVLCDFGLASFVEESGISTGLTTSRSIKGSMRYMSPELHSEEEAKHTLESDVWAWGCTAFEIVTDCAPYNAAKGDGAILMAFMRKDPPGSTETLMSRLVDETSANVAPAFRTLPDCLTRCWAFEVKQRPRMPSILHQFFPTMGIDNTRITEDIVTKSIPPLPPSHAPPASYEPRPEEHQSVIAPARKTLLAPLLRRFESNSHPQQPQQLDSGGGRPVEDLVGYPLDIAASTPLNRNRVHIHNLPPQTEAQDLEILFRLAGSVVRTAMSLFDPGDRTSGTVVFESPEDAGRAIQMFNGYYWLGKKLEVRADRADDYFKLGAVSAPRDTGTASASRPERSQSFPISPGKDRLYVGNLPRQVTQQSLAELLRSAGSVIRVEINNTHPFGWQDYGTVVFASVRDAQIAIQMFNGYEWCGRRLEVREQAFQLLEAYSHSTAPTSAAAVVSPNGGRNKAGRDFSSGMRISPMSPQPTHITTPSQQITVRNLPPGAANEYLLGLFCSVGNVDFAEILFDDTRSKGGVGVVQFTTIQEAQNAIAVFFGGGLLNVAFSDRWHTFTPTAVKGHFIPRTM